MTLATITALLPQMEHHSRRKGERGSSEATAAWTHQYWFPFSIQARTGREHNRIPFL